MSNQESVSDIDKLKELFEYEMTGVLLHFKGETELTENDLLREYMEMEVPPAAVAFQLPESTVEDTMKISFAEVGTIALVDFQPQAKEAEKLSIHYENPLPLQVKFDAIHAEPDYDSCRVAGKSGEFKAVSVPELKKNTPPETINTAITNGLGGLLPSPTLSGAEVLKVSDTMKKQEDTTVTVSVPEVADFRRFRSILTHSNAGEMRMELPDSKISADKLALPSKKEQKKAVSVQVKIPNHVGFSSVFAPLEVERQQFADGVASEFDAEKLKLSPKAESEEHIRIQVAILDSVRVFSGFAPLKVERRQFQSGVISAINAEKLTLLPKTEPKGNISIQAGIPDDVRLSPDFAPPEVDRQQFQKETKFQPVSVANGDFRIQNVAIEQGQFPAVTLVQSVPDGGTKINGEKITKDSISVEMSPIQDEIPFSAPNLSTGTLAKAEYPDVPQKPDFSAYYQDILDSVKAGL